MLGTPTLFIQKSFNARNYRMARPYEPFLPQLRDLPYWNQAKKYSPRLSQQMAKRRNCLRWTDVRSMALR